MENASQPFHMRFRTIIAKTQNEKILGPDTNNGLLLLRVFYLISIHFPFNKSFPFGFFLKAYLASVHKKLFVLLRYNVLFMVTKT